MRNKLFDKRRLSYFMLDEIIKNTACINKVSLSSELIDGGMDGWVGGLRVL